MESNELKAHDNFLLSLPHMHDNNFRNSIVYLNKHDGDGANGWVINKELESRVTTRLRKSIQLGIVCPIYYGGPVDVTQVYVLHSDDKHIQNNTITLNENLCMTRDKMMINMLNNNEFPKFWRVMVGSCSWGAGQLESELLGSRTGGRSMWNILPYCKDLMWNINPQQQWDHGIKQVATMMTKSYLNF
mgnify:FL=1